MTTDPWSLSRTAASNTTIGGVSAAEGILPANLNNIDRALGAGLAELVYVLCGAITSAGSADAQTVTTSLSWASYAAGKMVSFKAGSGLTNTGACTLNVDGLGAKSIKDNAGNDPSAGAITAGGIYLCAYEATADAFLLLNPYSAAGSFLSNVVEDLTPQLGGNLDLNGHTITGLVIGTDVQAYDADLAALAANSSTGLIARTGAGTVAARTITASNGVAITNGDGVSGAPAIAADITNATDLAAPATDDELLIADTSASGAVRKADVASILALATSGLSAASQAELEAASSTTVATTPGRQQFHPSACKTWVNFNASVTVAASYNITSVTDDGTGTWTVNIATDMSSANFCGLAFVGKNGGSPLFCMCKSAAAGTFGIETYTTAGGAPADPSSPNAVFFAAFGDQ